MKPLTLRFIGAALLLVFSFSDVDAQDQGRGGGNGDGDRPAFWDRIFFGGNLGLQFGDLTFVDISPLIGYKLTDQLAVGIGGTYIYYRSRTQFLINGQPQIFEYKTNIYGGRLFTRYYFVENLFGHAEYEILNLEVPDDFIFNKLTRTNITSFFIGGGYRQMLGGRAALELMGLYNLTEEANSPYVNPVIRIGVVAGF